MAIRPSVPEIITVNSEELQTQIRDLLPSQNGFGSELQATNVITPIIDLTRAAEGSGLPDFLQRAASFGSVTSFDVVNTTATLINTTGFYQVDMYLSTNNTASLSGIATLDISDGLGSKQLYEMGFGVSTLEFPQSGWHQLVVFLAAGHSLSATSSSTTCRLSGFHRQLATGDGTLIQPSGYPL
jgi:hypothetical protein